MLNVTQEQKEQLKEAAKKHDLRFIIAHGSYVTGQSRRGSDLDIAVMGNEYISSKEVMEMFSDFADIFGNNRKRELDLKSLHGKDPLFRYLVVKDSQLLYGDGVDFNEFKSYAYRAYEEAQPLFDFEKKFVRRRVDRLLDKVS